MNIHKQRISLGLFAEKYSPIFLGFLSFLFLIYFSQSIFLKISLREWNLSGLYSSIFGWSSIQTGFSFGVYGFVLSKEGGFVGSLKGTTVMSRFESYIKRANVAGFLLTFASMPLIVVDPKIESYDSFEYYLISLWFSFFVWSFVSFLRLSYNFGVLVSVGDKKSFGA